MKLKHVGMIVVSVLAMSSAAVSAAEGDESVTTTVNGGVIHFKGEVVNAACAIDSESMNQTVELGQVRSSRLAKAGDLILVPFLSISRRPIRHLQMAPVTAGNRLNPSTANPSTRQEPISRSQDIAILRKVFITYPTVPTVE